MEKLLLIYPGKGILDRTNVLNIPVVVISKPNTTLKYPSNVLLNINYSDNFSDLEKKLKNITFDAVLGLSEDSLKLTSYIKEKLLHIKGEISINESFGNKLRMRNQLDKKYSVNYKQVSDIKDIHFFLDNYQKGVLKPISGRASKFVIEIEKNNFSYEKLLRLIHSDSYLIEEFIPGREFSVETFSENGNHEIIAIAEKIENDTGIGNKFVDLGYALPAVLSIEEFREIQKSVVSCLNSLNYRFGPAHTEVKLHSGKSFIIETHNRVGGAIIPDQVQSYSGFDLQTASICQALGLAYYPEKINLGMYQALSWIQCSPGIISSVNGLHFYRSFPGVKEIKLSLDVGDRVKPLIDKNSWPGYVWTYGRSYDETIKLATKISRCITIETK